MSPAAQRACFDVCIGLSSVPDAVLCHLSVPSFQVSRAPSQCYAFSRQLQVLTIYTQNNDGCQECGL